MSNSNSVRTAARRSDAGDSSQLSITDTRAVRFDYLETILGFQLGRAHFIYGRMFDKHFGGQRLTPAQIGVLATINTNPGLTQIALSGALQTDPSRMVALIDSLQERRLVVRMTSTTDRRARALFLTPTGRALLRRAQRTIQKFDAYLMAGLDDIERRTLFDLLVFQHVNNAT